MQLSKALLRVNAISDEGLRSQSSGCAGAPSYLGPVQLGEALAIVKAISDEYSRSYAVAALLGWLPLACKSMRSWH